jgi:hypothetical protein
VPERKRASNGVLQGGLHEADSKIIGGMEGATRKMEMINVCFYPMLMKLKDLF